MDFQFYPTPPSLARRLWAKFKDKTFSRVLEPHAGDGALVKARPYKYSDSRDGEESKIDCCEIDVTKHPALRELGCEVVGVDFLKFTNGAIYSHIILNPPFAEGAAHVLKAWNILWDGEIAAIVNAETIRNPFSKERQFLVDLITSHGDVEFLEDAFMSDDAMRKTPVDVALIHLRKRADMESNVFGNLLEELKVDMEGDFSGEFKEGNAVTLPNTFIETSVATFNAAIRAMRDSILGQARAAYYANILGDTMATRNGDAGSGRKPCDEKWVRKEMAKGYSGLKDRAWAGILRSADVTSRLSSQAQKRMEADFETIKKLEFTVSNIYGFLCGVVDSQGEIQTGMICDVFDAFVKYHSDNACFYRGWNSNDRHRTCGMRLKTTRVVLPYFEAAGYRNGLDFEQLKILSDFDKVFSMLDGKNEPEVSLHYLFENHFGLLRTAKRMSTSYFDVRWFQGVGTIHFFPKRKDLVERLNRVVGAKRQWLPADMSQASDGFVKQFEEAEKYEKDIREEVARRVRVTGLRDPFRTMTTSGKPEMVAIAEALFDEAATCALEKHGIDVDFRLTGKSPATLLLAA